MSDPILAQVKEALRISLLYFIHFAVFVQCFLMSTLLYILRVILHLFTAIPQLKHLRMSLMRFLPQINPDVYAKAEDLIMSHIEYKIETHRVLTEDGYYLTAWRVLSSDKKKSQEARSKAPVILMHGLLDCSFSWFVNKERQMCLPYILADQGYDVWCMNNRGNRYSLGHKYFKHIKSNSHYWNYGFDELAKYDVKSNVQYVLDTTCHSKVFYVGHSQGSTQMFAKLMEDPQFQEKIKAFIALGPAIYIQNLASNFVKKMFGCGFYQLLDKLGYRNFLVLPKSISRRVGALCHYLPFLYDIGLFKVMNLLCGFTVENKIPRDKISVIVTHEPGGASVRNILQWEQFMKSGEFKKFDFGASKNIKVYGQAKPPCYNTENLKKITIPQHLFIGTSDIVGNKLDTDRLLQLVNPDASKIYTLNDYAHLDYVWGTDANTVLYPQIIKILKAHQTT
ncbi:hypothetical protein ABPG72_022357 [Tetrahymena utriculariae]